MSHASSQRRARRLASPLAAAATAAALSLWGCGATETAPVTPPVTLPPVASLAAPSTLEVGQPLVLDGSASSAAAGRTLRRWLWRTADAGHLVNLPLGVEVSTTQPTLALQVAAGDFLPVGTWHFSLTVEDDAGRASPAATAVVEVVDLQHPTAVLTGPAAPVALGAAFTLAADGSIATTGLSLAEYRWTNVDFAAAAAPFAPGQTVVTSVPALTVAADGPAGARAAGGFRFRLVVVDNAGDASTPAEATVTVAAPDRPTAVLSAPGLVPVGAGFTLDGTASSATGGALAAWEFTNLDCPGLPGFSVGTTVSLAAGTLALAPAPGAAVPPGRYRFQLVVVDGAGGRSDPAFVDVVVFDGEAPTAVLDGPGAVSLGASITLSFARSFDVGGTVVAYTLTNLDCAGHTSLPSGQSVRVASPGYTLVVDPATPVPLGACSLQLVVEDDAGNRSQPDVLRLLVLDLTAPTAVLDGPATVAVGASFALSFGRSFDVGGTVAAYELTNLDCGGDFGLPTGVPLQTLSTGYTVSVSPGAPIPPGRCSFQLVVVDDSGNRSQPDVRQIVFLDQAAPTAVLDGPATVAAGASFAFSFARSFDVGGTVALYELTNLDCGGTTNLPAGQVAQVATPAFTVDVNPAEPIPLGRCSYQLVVVDDSGNRSQPDVRLLLVADLTAPTAVLQVAGPTQPRTAPLTLDGTRSFDQAPGTIVEYRWSEVDPKGTILPLTSTATPTLTVPPTGGLRGSFPLGAFAFQLEVVDSSGNLSAPDVVTVTFQ